jgi:hypothetical protein
VYVVEDVNELVMSLLLDYDYDLRLIDKIGLTKKSITVDMNLTPSSEHEIVLPCENVIRSGLHHIDK